MQIKTAVETEDGHVEIHADLTPEQLRFLIEVGLSVVLSKGAHNFVTDLDKKVMSAPKVVQ